MSVEVYHLNKYLFFIITILLFIFGSTTVYADSSSCDGKIKDHHKFDVNLPVGSEHCYQLPSWVNMINCTVTQIAPPIGQDEPNYPTVNIIQYYSGPDITGVPNIFEEVKKVGQKLILPALNSVDTMQIHFEFDTGQAAPTRFIRLKCIFHTDN